jgi:NAD(P)-dependent dehydrogenase (short-subunit alcohol dehydrogenase family)
MTRSIFITGASSGIGAALALEFARRGYHVAIAARRTDLLRALATDLATAGARKVLPVELDVVDYASVGPTLERAVAEFGRLDTVVANAGVAGVTPVGKGRFELTRRTIEVNLLGAIATIEAAVPILRRQGGGQVVGITSMAGWRGLAGFGAYSASKAGLHRYLQSLRAEVHREKIVVTELSPGFIDTDLNRGMGARPFLIDVRKGGALMARMIERQVGYRTVPVLPWSLVGPLLKILPTALTAPRTRARRESDDRPQS